MAWRDYLQNPQEGINSRGHLLDDETVNKKAARQSASRSGRLNLFEIHPDKKRILPVKQHLREKTPLRPVEGKPWYKTYRIKEEASSTLCTLFCSDLLTSLTREPVYFTPVIEN